MSGALDTKYLNSCLVFLLARTWLPESGHWLGVPLMALTALSQSALSSDGLVRLGHGTQGRLRSWVG